ncbi:Uncharacterized protein CLAVI_000158 [Candidatus Clavichlamydia salmonicola]|uniref:CCA tRNA nucleotidyltransferase n=1 Tax=Candidatus Clavichlamydia salmonicola TaxID=469812 RepID=UPI0018912C1E|nr:CCA tRNA nucleotidyltransferase [Candidatus Clavichlamydia salmonicola]MBF5050547.1 Uncharacterized protein [Candidatus Clavichlamydia salmonicola]
MTNKIASAKEVIHVLAQHGFKAFFVGGYVRDMLLHIPSIDIDIATDASVEEIIKLFPKTLLIGAAFGIVVVIINNFSFDVSSFREDGTYEDGRHPTSIKMGSIITDSLRRDFTINALFYNPFDNTIIDHVQGLTDIKKKLIRTVGQPVLRFAEDRLRMVRACRFAATLNFKIDKETNKAILHEHSFLYPSVSKERVHQEFTKLEQSPYKYRFLMLMYASGLLQQIFPVFKNISFFHFKKEAHYLKKCVKYLPLPIFLAPLFKIFSANIWPVALLDLKVSKKDHDLALLWNESLCILFPLTPSVESIHFFCKPGVKHVIELHLLLLSSLEEKEQFLQKINDYQIHYKPHILRAAEKKFPLSSDDLIKKGVLPGKKMGNLLRKSEKIAIQLNTCDKIQILTLLKNDF